MTDLLRNVNLYLIGMMGSGKTTVGQILAKELDYRFFDTDAVVEQATGQTVPQIFAESGEAIFRQLETEVLSNLSAYKRLAIATGGGIVLERKNWSYLQYGIVVWLDVSIDHLYERLQNDSANRPLLHHPDPKQKLEQLLEERRSLYAQADVRISVQPDDTAADVARQVLEVLATVVKPQAVPISTANNDSD